MTEKLYQFNSYITEFDAKIIKKEKSSKGIKVILDKTYFYPTSGGQQCDQGIINNIKVKEVLEEGEEIIHLLEEEPLEENVHCVIDKERRYTFMQQHTGQHILSHCFLEKKNAPTLSAHMGELRNTIDIQKIFLKWEDVIEVEKLANEIIFRGIPIKIHFYNNVEECPFQLRKEPIFEGKLRVIEIEGVEASACGGTHCSNTREVGLIKIINFEKYKAGYRIEFQCGYRALKDYQNKCLIIHNLKSELNSKEEELVNSVSKIKETERHLKKEIEELNWRYLELVAEIAVKEYIANPTLTFIKELKDYNLEKLKRLALLISEKVIAPIILFSKSEKIDLVIAKRKGSDYSLKRDCLEILNQYNWRGGGSDDMIMGALSLDTKIEELIDKLKAKLDRRG